MFLSMKSLGCVGPMIEKCTHRAPLTPRVPEELKAVVTRLVPAPLSPSANS